MKAKIIILTPVYNDWKNLTKLLAKIDIIFKNNLKKKFDLIVVNDSSTEKPVVKKLKFKSVNKLRLISLVQNVGSQRALAIGIKCIDKIYKKNYKLIIIDSDGQDNPEAITKLINYTKKKKKFAIAVNRGQRKEALWFKIFYESYCLLINMFAGKKVRFGNYSLLSSDHVKKIKDCDDLWSAYPPTISNNIKNIHYITMDREKRFSGKSKMNFFGLVCHAFRVFSVFRLKILISSSFYLILNYIFFFKNNFNILFYFILIILILLNTANFLISIFNRNKFQITYNKTLNNNF